jgi:periplasmic divalent cation tolerance protein
MMDALFVYVTCKDREEALKVGQAVVEATLAACANVIDGMDSIYWWEGKMETAIEAILILKSRSGLLDALTEMVKAHHSYSVPCVVALPILGGNPDYLKWMRESTSSRA